MKTKGGTRPRGEDEEFLSLATSEEREKGDMQIPRMHPTSLLKDYNFSNPRVGLGYIFYKFLKKTL